MYSVDYLIERFERALYALATDFGDARCRIDAAHGHLIALRLEDYPEHLRSMWQEIEQLLTRLPGREGFVVVDNLRKMRKATASRICALIVELYFELVEHQRRAEAQR